MPRRSPKEWVLLAAVGGIMLLVPQAAGIRVAAALEESAAGPRHLLARALEGAANSGAGESSLGGAPAPAGELPQLGGPRREYKSPGIAGIAETERRVILRKLSDWLRYQSADEDSNFETIIAFIEGNPDWPGIGRLRRGAERSVTPEVPFSVTVAWFDENAPLSADGALAYASALYRAGDERATETARRIWVSYDLGARAEADFLEVFGGVLTAEDHWERLDRLLWKRQISAAQRQLVRVDRGYRALAEARLALMRQRRGVDAAIESVPASLADDPGLAYERLRWRRRKDMDQAAIDILLSPPTETPYASRWWVEREILARRMLAEGDPGRAYDLVRDHRLSEGIQFADAEFLAGWISLRFLGDAETALSHFNRLYEFVRFPISRARAAYWAGRASEALGDDQASARWYQHAADHTTTFYGQLAALRLNEIPPPAFFDERLIRKDVADSFDANELVRAVRVLIALRDGELALSEEALSPQGLTAENLRELADANDDRILEPFLRHIARQSTSPEEWVLAAGLAREAGRADVAVYIARRAARDGVVLGNMGYPTIVIPDDLPPDAALLHALVRQESGFDVEAHSRAGARGLMQLMPGTARRVARSLNLRNHSTERLTSDPHHNVLLGATYLESMLERFDGSMVMALAAYNAGPRRVNIWLKQYGDPRGSLDKTIDWIESIPFSETRNYVQRILETVPIYRWKLEGAQMATLRHEDLAGPLPADPESER